MLEPIYNGACEMKPFEFPNTWAGLFPSKAACTFSIAHKGILFSGVHSLNFEDELKPVVVTIEKLYMDDNCRDIIGIVDPAITYWIEDELARN